MLGAMGRFLYEKLYRGYTRKQWGRDPSELNASLANRFRPRTDGDDRYFTDRYQGMPRDGYTRLFENMLDHARIRIELGVDYRDVVRRTRWKTLIYTGPIDEYFSYRFGALPYRSLRFEHRTLPQRRFQPAGVVNYPNDHAFTRITEFKYLTGQSHAATSIAYEFPTAEGEPFYPVPAPDALTTYERYRKLADQQRNVVFLGRLGTYKYLNMDQVVAQSLAMARRV
jgi:UDP-galactopyranose mutase